jgi:hypothetical protein
MDHHRSTMSSWPRLRGYGCPTRASSHAFFGLRYSGSMRNAHIDWDGLR